MIAKGYAKLNLSLNVGPSSGGFHSVDGVSVTVDVFNTVKIEKRLDDKIEFVDNPYGEDNVALKVARAFQQKFSTRGFSIEVQKQIPTKAGMAGSSADASATLVALCSLFDVHIKDVLDIARQYGSDIAYLIKGGLAKVYGKGDDVEQVEFCPLNFVVVTFEQGLSTKEVFQTFDKVGSHCYCDNDKLLSALMSGQIHLAQKLICNGLYLSAKTIATKALKDDWQSLDDWCAKNLVASFTLTGTGSAKFLLTKDETEAKELAHQLQKAGFSAFATKSTPVGVAT